MQRTEPALDESGWKVVSSRSEFTTAHLAVATEQVQTPSRPESREWAVVRRKPAVVIAPITREGKFVLVRQERIPIRATIWEMPAGQIDERGELSEVTIRNVALRELTEETGYELAPDGELSSLGDYFSSPGFTDEHGFFFLARPVVKSKTGPTHDAGEAIVDCREFSADTLRVMIAESDIRDANTLSTWARLIARGDLFP